MGKTSSTILMNGKRYNATTGALLDDTVTTDATTVVVKPAKAKNIDGFNKSKNTHVDLAPARIAPLPIQPAVSKPSIDGFAPRRKTAKHAVKTPQTSQTLMRHAVKKPGTSTKRAIKAHSHTGALVKNPVVAPKQSVATINERRASSALKTPKSTLIKKFNATKPHSNPEQLAAKPAQATKAAQPAPPPIHGNDMFKRAIEQAVSHEEPFAAKPGKANRRAAVTVVVMAVAIGVGFAGVNGVKAAKVQMASSKAGFSISQPTYTPAGFSLSNMSSEAGSASLNFVSNSDQRSFAIIEKASQWDSASLKSTLDASGKKLQTVESAGRTIFIDESFNANWVNGGVWYQIQNVNALNNRQIVNIATSL